MLRMFRPLQCFKLVLTRNGVWSPVKYIALNMFLCIWSLFVYFTVVCVSCFLKPGSHWRSFHVWRVRWSVPWSFSPRKVFVALGYGVVFVAHRKISFVSCMVGLPIVCSICCVVWFFTFLGSRAVFIRCVLFEWIGVGVVLSPLHVKIGPGRSDGKDCVVNVLGIFTATVVMLVFKGLFRAWSIFYIYLVFEKLIQICIGIA